MTLRPALVALVLATLVLGSADALAAPKKKKAVAKPVAAATVPGDDDKPVNGEAGTTIVGDSESPIGLYITPWKDEYAERGLDRPARLLDEELQPIDKATFARQVEYFQKIDAYRKAKLAAGETIK